MKNGVLILSAAGFVKGGCERIGNGWSWHRFHEAERVRTNVQHFRCAQGRGALTTTYDPTIDGAAYERLHCSNYAAAGGLLVSVGVILPAGSTCSYTRGCWPQHRTPMFILQTQDAYRVFPPSYFALVRRNVLTSSAILPCFNGISAS
jgi:hypothetical protein